MQNALPLGRAFGLLQPYCQGLFQHLATLFIMVAHLGRKSKKMIANELCMGEGNVIVVSSLKKTGKEEIFARIDQILG